MKKKIISIPEDLFDWLFDYAHNNRIDMNAAISMILEEKRKTDGETDK